VKKIFHSALFMLLAYNTASAQLVKTELQVAGLTCSMCSKATDKQLRTLDFIESIDIDLDHATFILHFKKEKVVDFGQIKKKVQDAGFSVAMLKSTFHFDNLKIENDTHFNYQNMLFNFINVQPQILTGEVAIKIIDKGFVSDKEYKKYEKLLAPVTNPSKPAGQEIYNYHVTL
jgi:copper chaperone CopZ